MSEEKREEATPKAERRARERGRVWQSRDLTLGAVLIGCALALGLVRESLGPSLLALMRAPFTAIAESQPPGSFALAITTDGLSLLAPILGLIVVLAALTSVLQVGPLFAPRAVEIDGGRLDPSTRLLALFDRRAAATFAMTLARLALVLGVVLVTLREALPGIATLARQTPGAALDACVSVTIALFFRAGLAVFALGTVDAVLERTLYRRSLRMSRREIAREHREAEGDAHVRRERDRVRNEAREHDDELSAETARLVITDGELAIALRYDEADADAVPHVVAVGRSAAGERILAIAIEHRIACVTDEALADQLAIVPLGHPIPEALYEAVARRLHEGRAPEA